MSLLKNKLFIPLCLAGILTGYAAAQFVAPRYFHPTVETRLTPEDIIAAIGAQPNYFRQTKSGNYLAGQFAQRHKDWDQANSYINNVLRRDQENEDLERHSMVLSMAAGDVKRAISTAQSVLKEDPQNILGLLFTSLDYFKREDYANIETILSSVEKANVAAFIVPVLKLWAEAGEGNLNINTLPYNSFYGYQVLLAGDYLSQRDKALAYAKRAFKPQENDIRDLEKYADAFAAYGEIQKALEIYKFMEKQNFANEDIINKIVQIEAQDPLNEDELLPNIISPKDGAALVFQDMAEILLREYSDDSATIFAQMALYLNPDLFRNYAIIGEVYNRYERYDDAIETLKKIDQSSELYIEVQRQIAELYTKQEKNDKAITILQKLYETVDDIDALVQIGDIYRYQEDYEMAAQTYTNVIEKWDGNEEKIWHVYYARGMSLERLKRFKESEEDLEKALEYRPNNPYLLNYLGYSWVDQGINLEESLDMISRAVAYKPNDGYITDSLGWVYYKMGQYEEAIPYLERAVELLPYDPTINDHLGDAYWKVGRKNEAKFQWQRALNYNEDKDESLKESLKGKLASGLKEETNNSETVTPIVENKNNHE